MVGDARPSAWRTVGAQKRWLRICSSAPSPASDFPGSPRSHYLQARRRPPPSPVPTALCRSQSAEPRSSAPQGSAAGCTVGPRPERGSGTPRAAAVPFPAVQQGPSRRRLGPVRAPRHAGRGLGPRPGRRGAGREAEARASACRSRTRRSRGLGGHEDHSSRALRR